MPTTAPRTRAANPTAAPSLPAAAQPARARATARAMPSTLIVCPVPLMARAVQYASLYLVIRFILGFLWIVSDNVDANERWNPRCLRFSSARLAGLAALPIRCDICMQLLLYSGCSNSTPSTWPWLDVPLPASSVWCRSVAEAPIWLGLYHVRSGQRQRSKLFGTGAERKCQAAHAHCVRRRAVGCSLPRKAC